MTASVWHLRTSQKVLIALIGLMSTLDPAFAVPPTLDSSGLTAEQCYRRDSDCTVTCGEATEDMKYECFGICDRMLGHCLDTGDWTDSELQIDPGTGKPPGISIFHNAGYRAFLTMPSHTGRTYRLDQQ